MKITRISVKDYRGIKQLDVAIPAGGAIVKGRNAEGKSSLVNAIRAALDGQGISRTDIHVGATVADIMVDLDALKVRRIITPSGSDLTVENADGDHWSSPATRLREMIGAGPLDALEFFLAKPERRRQLVLEAMPITVTAEDFTNWIGTPLVGEDLSGHGLEVVARVQKRLYDQRTAANKRADESAAEAKRARASLPPAIPDALPIASAVTDERAALTAFQELTARRHAAEVSAKAVAGQQARLGELELKIAIGRRERMPSPGDNELANASDAVDEIDLHIRTLEQEIAAARERRRQAHDMLVGLQLKRSIAEREQKALNALNEEAERVRMAIAEVQAINVTAEELDAANKAWAAATKALDRARAAADQAVHAEHVRQIENTAKVALDHADTLDRQVTALTKVAPAQLAARGNAIPGLALNDKTITLDGVPIDTLSGAEQLRFAINLARRLNAKSRILVVDGLERVDPEQYEAFIAAATEDDWQLIGTRVDRGDLTIEAIER